MNQFRGAELIAEKWNISREDMEEFAIESHLRAITARAEGRFKGEIAPLGDAARTKGRVSPTSRRSARSPRWCPVAG